MAAAVTAAAGMAPGEDLPPPPHVCEYTAPPAGASPSAATASAAADVERRCGHTVAAADEEAARTHLLVSHLTREIDRLGEQQERYRRECEEQRKGNETLQHELSRLQAENAGLCHRVAREREIRAGKCLIATDCH